MKVDEAKALLAEAEAEEALIAAKAAYRADPSEKNRKARDKAIEGIVAVRNEVRSGRKGPKAEAN